jgi:hypothetical protein
MDIVTLGGQSEMKKRGTRGNVIDSFVVWMPDYWGDLQKHTFRFHDNGRVYDGRYLCKSTCTSEHWNKFKREMTEKYPTKI